MKIITNCPNCGSALQKLKCQYCGTEIRYSNEIELFNGEKCELMLRHNNGKNVTLIPVEGYISSISVTPNYEDIRTFSGEVMMLNTGSDVEFNFVGQMKTMI